MLLKELREQVAYYGRQMLTGGLTMHTGGNLSARDPKSGLIAIKPSGRPYDTLRPEDVTVIDLCGKIIDGSYAPSCEWPMHTLIYRTYSMANAVVHCHSPSASAMAAAGVELPLISHEICIYCTAPARVTPFAVPGTPELAKQAVAGFGNNNDITLLKNHGTVAMGASLWLAYDAACAAELTAKIYLAALPLGGAEEVPAEGRMALRAMDPMAHILKPETVNL